MAVTFDAVKLELAKYLSEPFIFKCIPFPDAPSLVLNILLESYSQIGFTKSTICAVVLSPVGLSIPTVIVLDVLTFPVVSATLATSYVKQFKIFDALNEMRRIKKLDPTALDETCYNGLGFFKLFI